MFYNLQNILVIYLSYVSESIASKLYNKVCLDFFKLIFMTKIHNEIDFNNKTILITGGAGFIGSNLAFYFQDHFPQSNIVIFDCFRNTQTFPNGNIKSFGHYKNLIGFKGNIICGNLNNKSDLLLLSSYNFDYIFHHAAISDTRVYNQEVIMQTNINSFYDILDLAKQNSAPLIYASSAATYGSLPSPQIEGNESPENPYGYSKYVMDQIANKYATENKGMKIVGLRFFNVYGPREYYKANTASMIIQLGHQILDEISPRLFENSHLIFRDFIYINDVIQANIKACNPKNNGYYNIGTGVSRSFQDVADILQKELNTNLSIEYFSNPYTGYQMNTQADISSAQKNLEFNPNFSLEDGIKDYIPEIERLHGEDIS
jgi:ADP-L-glycero-D-manno-heptose 6-epimerase